MGILCALRPTPGKTPRCRPKAPTRPCKCETEEQRICYQWQQQLLLPQRNLPAAQVCLVCQLQIFISMFVIMRQYRGTERPCLDFMHSPIQSLAL